MLKLTQNLTNVIDKEEEIEDIEDIEELDDDGYILAEDIINEGGSVKRRADILTGARQKGDFSRREAALRLGISPKELKAMEKGFIKPSKKLILKMAGLYSVSLQILWEYAL